MVLVAALAATESINGTRPSLACQLIIKKNPGDSEAMVRVYRNSNGPGHLPRRTAVSGTMAEGSCAAGFHVTVNFRLGVDLS